MKTESLCAALGNGYRTTIIDFENVIHKDLKNGFDIEISGVCTANRKNKGVTIWLWHTHPYITVTHVKTKTADPAEVKAAVQRLYELSERLIRDGLNNWSGIMHYKDIEAAQLRKSLKEKEDRRND